MEVDASAYDVEKTLGAGGQGVVYLWKSKKDNVRYAVKVFANPKPQQSDRFMTEAQVLTKFVHPCLVRGFGFSLPKKVGDPAVLLME
jgi:serine/threonine protein kinase